VDKDLERPRNVSVPSELLSRDVSGTIKDPNIDIVVELIGGIEPARTFVLEALRSGKHVVTANKALLAEQGRELFAEARRAGRAIAFEASVAGGVPIIAALSQSLVANEIRSIHAILNGTSNYILTRMEQTGAAYHDALAEAQHLGYAEADPTLDITGADAAQKLAILAALAFGAQPDWKAIPRQGIDLVEQADLRYARELGYTIKLIASAELYDGQLFLQVAPTLVRHRTPLAEVWGAFNAIEVVGDAVGRVFFHGQGAGQMPTASAVVADVIDLVVGRGELTFRTLPMTQGDGPAVSLADPCRAKSRFYLRLRVVDRPGVLAEIAGILGRLQISIASVIQHEAEPPQEDGVVPLVIMTHAAEEGPMRQAIEAIEKLAVVRDKVVRFRVQD
jgi:homoserine dehydrogenase